MKDDMRKIAFHFYNDGVPNVDFTTITEGNPGVGGTVFLAVLIPTLLASRPKVAPILLSNKDCLIPPYLPNVVCGDIYGALEYCRANKDIDAIVVDSKKIYFDIIRQYPDVNIILWANNPMSINYLRGVTYLSNVPLIINVSKEQCDLYRDMNVFKKSTYIYNAFPIDEVLKNRKNLQPTRERKNYVVYVASILPQKGFHLLAKAWPRILECVPDAELFIIGSGKLYNKQNKLGPWGISIPSYEKVFMPYLTKDDTILPSVHFLGEMGVEKYKILSKCKVGVPNPSGATETFGYTAIEMQALGCLVTTRKCPGYIDTVYDKSQLYDNPKELAQRVVSLLISKENVSEEVLTWIIDNFGCDSVIERWENVLCSDFSENVMHESLSEKDMNFHHKRLKEIVRKYTHSRVKDFIIPIEKLCPNLDGISFFDKIHNKLLHICKLF